MSWAKIVKKYCGQQGIPFDGDNREGYVPSRGREPHLHCGGDFVTFTDVGHSHSDIADDRLRSSASDVLKDLEKADGDAVEQVARVVKHLITEYR